MFHLRKKENITLSNLEETIPDIGMEEWEEVVGYKGTNRDMQGFGGYQFELGKTYLADGEIKICENGFHFCKELIDVNSYHSWEHQSRYFKVKARVKRADYLEYGKIKFDSCHNCYIANKLVASKITFLEEISPEVIYDTFLVGNKIFFTKEDFLNFYKTSNITAKQYILRQFCDLLDGKYSRAFISYLGDMLYDRFEKIQQFDTYAYYTKLRKIETFANALYAEGVGVDMRAYMLIDFVKGV